MQERYTRAQRYGAYFLGVLIMIGWFYFAYGVLWLIDRYFYRL